MLTLALSRIKQQGFLWDRDNTVKNGGKKNSAQDFIIKRRNVSLRNHVLVKRFARKKQ
jgi:hypothetical protein